MILKVLESKKVEEYILKRDLLKQYKKAKKYLLSDNFQAIKFKLRHPKESGIYSFRINKQFRALGILRNETLIIFKIDNHQ
jgi:plasmid maintenance system killer protein